MAKGQPIPWELSDEELEAAAKKEWDSSHVGLQFYVAEMDRRSARKEAKSNRALSIVAVLIALASIIVPLFKRPEVPAPSASTPARQIRDSDARRAEPLPM